MRSAEHRVAILGGTGDLGSGLAYQLARAAYPVAIGSRSEERARAAAETLRAKIPRARVTAGGNASVAAGADIVLMTVPFATHDATVESVRSELKGKILVDATVPLVPPKVMRVQLPPGGSVAVRAQELLGDDVRVVSAFQNIAAAHLKSDDLRELACDVLVSGDDPGARQCIVTIAEDIGLKAWHAGPLANSVVAESLTSVLIFLNRKYGLEGAGIRIAGKPKRESP